MWALLCHHTDYAPFSEITPLLFCGHNMMWPFLPIIEKHLIWLVYFPPIVVDPYIAINISWIFPRISHTTILYCTSNYTTFLTITHILSMHPCIINACILIHVTLFLTLPFILVYYASQVLLEE